MKLLSFQLFLGLLLSLFLVRPIFAQEQYFFNEEFNEVRPPQTLNPDKWIVYPNRNSQADYLGCLVDTITETGGLLILRQCSTNTQSPYIVSKVSPFPDGNFTATVRFQFPGARGFPTGIKFVDVAPENGGGATELFGIGFEEDVFQGFSIEYKDTVVYTKGTDSNYHIFKAVKTDNTYKLYLNDQLVFTSPETNEKVHAIYIGSPVITEPLGYGWTFPRVDYIRVVNDGPSKTTPQPFLDLPWNYGDKDFKQIIYDPNSWFDHKYPLQNFACCAGPIIDYKGKTKDKSYKSHSGYDYGLRHEINGQTQVKAAAAGVATFINKNNSGGAGNTIKIDHKNGYQTWYEHLEEATPGSQLIVSEEGKAEEVDKGEVIGKVGLTGRTTGYHIHLSVFKDTNANGDFSDDYPFGLTDPLGWEGDYTDPWEEYTSGGKNGAKSYKLFTQLTGPKTQQVPPSGGTVVNDKLTLTIPENASSATLTYKIEDGPFETASETIKSIVPSVFLSATNSLGLLITNFNNPLNLVYNYSKASLDNINEDTLSFYYLNEQSNLWEKIASTLDKTNKTISAPTTHFSQFAVMGELLDSTPPTTTAEIAGTKGNSTWYLSDVVVSLKALDNPDGKGIDYIVYSYDGEHYEEYTQPLSFNTEGSHKLYFLSHDKAGNEESAKSIEFSIDKAPPEAKIEVDKSLWDLKITPVSTDSTIIKTPGKKPNEFTYLLNDPSGNTLTLETYYINTKYIDFLKIYSLKYNAAPKTLLPDNTLDTNYLFYTPKTKPEIKIINQNFIIKDKITFIILADALKQKTLLNILENGTRRKEEKPNLTLLKLQTNNGKLEYSY